MGNLLNNKSTIQELIIAINSLPDIVDTSNATALSEHVLGGKTAYVNGQKITGTMAFQPAKTITPTTTSQIAISSGCYAKGDITVKGDNNLVASNIKKGVKIFDVSGTFVGDGSTDTSVEDAFVTRNISSNYQNSRVSTIGDYAFCNCSNLVTVNLPNVTNIGESAFYSCKNLSSVSLPNVTNIGKSAFYSCKNLNSVSFPNVTIIDDGAFGFPTIAGVTGILGLTEANFPATTSIGSEAFANCYNLNTISFPATTNIGYYAFYCCFNLTSVNFPLCTSIGVYAFGFCSSLTTVSFPACTSIGQSVFYGCHSLSTADFPLVTNIGYSAFGRCYSLIAVNFPTCTNISDYAFRSCHGLAAASFPNVADIGSYVFFECYNLKSLYLTGSSLCKLSNSNAFASTPIGGYSASTGTYGSIYVPASLLTSYQTATNWTYFSSRFVAFDGGD